jgi:hypothetical protein
MNELLMRGGRVSVPFNCFSFSSFKKILIRYNRECWGLELSVLMNYVLTPLVINRPNFSLTSSPLSLTGCHSSLH